MHYFAYGSNLNLEHMHRICGWSFLVLGVAELNGYKIGPDGRGYFNIKPAKTEKVLGVLYELGQWELDALDKFEGHPNVFARKEVEVLDPAGKLVKAWVYAEEAEDFSFGEIKPDFLRRVLIGARENHMPESWIKYLESFSAK